MTCLEPTYARQQMRKNKKQKSCKDMIKMTMSKDQPKTFYYFQKLASYINHAHISTIFRPRRGSGLNFNPRLKRPFSNLQDNPSKQMGEDE